MGCYMGKEQSKVVFKDRQTNEENTIKIERQHTSKSQKIQQEDADDKEINLILSPVKAQITTRNPQQVLKEIVRLSDQCIEAYNEHDIDSAYSMFLQIQTDLKQLEKRGFKVQMNQHFKQQFIQICHILTSEYNDMIDFNNEILKEGWKLQKNKKNFKVFSRIEDHTVGIRLESVLQVPFQNFIAVMIQPDHYNEFLPFIQKSTQLKNVRRNCKLGMIEMSFPILSNRQAYFQGTIYNRLNNKNPDEQQFFMYTRSIHNRKDLQELFGYDVKLNPKCVQLDYKYLVIKYVPVSQTSGKMIMGVNIDLHLNVLPLAILEMVSISFSEDFFGNIVKISQKFEGSIWDEGIRKHPQLFEFMKKTKNDYLRKVQRGQGRN